MSILSVLSLYLGKKARIRIIVPTSSYNRFKSEMQERLGSKTKIVLATPHYRKKLVSGEELKQSKNTAIIIEISGSNRSDLDNFVAEFGKKLKEEIHKKRKPPRKKTKKPDNIHEILKSRRESRSSGNLRKRPKR